MRVMCVIRSSWMQIANFNPRSGNAGPKYGDIDIVVGEIEFKGEKFYQLERFPGDDFDSRVFIPISEMDETTFKREPVRRFNHWPVDKSIKHLL